MKTEFLKELGLTDEQISSIMKENGKDISKEQQKAEKVNQELENIKSELNSKDQVIADANAQIEKFKSIDVDSIKAQAEEWKNKYTEFENQSKAEKEAFAKELENQKYDFAVKEFIGQHKFTNDFVKEAFINDFKSKGLKMEEGKFLGADDYINTFKEKNPGVFVVEEAPKQPVPEIVKPTNGQAPKTKMSLMDMMKMKNENPNAQLPIE